MIGIIGGDDDAWDSLDAGLEPIYIGMILERDQWYEIAEFWMI